MERLNEKLNEKDKIIQEFNEKISNQDIELTEQIKKLETIINEQNDQLEDLKRLQLENQQLKKELEELKKINRDLEEKTGKLEMGQEVIVGRENVINYINEMIKITKMSILIVTPKIIDLKDIDFSINDRIQIRVVTSLDFQSSQHLEILKKLQDLNIIIREYRLADRWGIDRDGEEIFIAPAGGNVFGLRVKNEEAIKLYKILITDAWLRGKIV